MHANINLTVLRIQTHNCKHTYTQRPQTKQWGSGLDGDWPDWHSTRLAGGQGLSGGPGIITCEWLPLSCSSPKEGTGEPRQAQRGGLTTTEVHVCFGLLLITVRHAAKPLSAATSSVKHTRAPASCWDAGQVVLLTVLWFGCPLVELEFREQGTILLVLLHIQAQSINYFIITGKSCMRLIVCD